MTDLVEWLRARLNEDEAAARAAGGGRWSWEQGYGDMCNDPGCPFGQLMSRAADEEIQTRLMDVHGYDVAAGWQGADHIARWDPSRVLAEVASKRRRIEALAAVVDGVQDGALVLAYELLQIEAIPYADRPGFDPDRRIE